MQLTSLVYQGNDLNLSPWYKTLEQLGITDTKAVFNHSTGTEVFVCISSVDKLIKIVVRGSEPPFTSSGIKDWVNNFLSIKRRYYGIRAHSGYARAAESVIEPLLAMIDLLPKEYAVTVEGHSLGGAVAVLLAVALGYSRREARFNSELRLITFGQRRVASSEDLKAALQCRYLRVQNGSDIACLTPMLPGYGDQGTCLYLPNDPELGPLLVDPSAWVKFKDRLFTGLEYFTDHGIGKQYESRLVALESGAFRKH